MYPYVYRTTTMKSLHHSRVSAIGFNCAGYIIKTIKGYGAANVSAKMYFLMRVALSTILSRHDLMNQQAWSSNEISVYPIIYCRGVFRINGGMFHETLHWYNFKRLCMAYSNRIYVTIRRINAHSDNVCFDIYNNYYCREYSQLLRPQAAVVNNTVVGRDIHIHTNTQTHIHIHTYTHTHKYTHTHTHTYIYIYIYIYIYM